MAGQAVSCAGSEEVRTPRCTLIMKGLSLPPHHHHPTPPHRSPPTPPTLVATFRHTHSSARSHSRTSNRHGDGTSPALSPGGGGGRLGGGVWRGCGAGAGNIAALSSLPLAKLITHSYTSPPCRGPFRRGYRLIKNTQRYTAAAQISIYFPTWIVKE